MFSIVKSSVRQNLIHHFTIIKIECEQINKTMLGVEVNLLFFFSDCEDALNGDNSLIVSSIAEILF